MKKKHYSSTTILMNQYVRKKASPKKKFKKM